MKTVGIIGGSGYTGGELVRIILGHPKLKLKYVYSSTKSGENIEAAHYDLIGESNLKFTKSISDDVDLLFLCLGHGNSKNFLEKNVLNSETIVIDLSHDFRLNKFSKFNDRVFTYGLPEFQKNKVKNSNNIANPGCFATSIQLAILPLAYSRLINDEIHVNSITGSTGAGVGLSTTSHFSQRNNNISWYKVFTHQHLNEINQTLNYLNGNEVKINFIPIRGNFTRGIFSTVYTNFNDSIDKAFNLYKDYYKEEPFVKISKNEIFLKQVVNTNNCHIHLHKHEDKLLITSIIDNLIKGASGQAIQNTNLIMGWNESLGLKFKGSIF